VRFCGVNLGQSHCIALCASGCGRNVTWLNL
jgi:hypothetical protein